MKIANKTARSAGAVSGKAITPRYVEEHADKSISSRIGRKSYWDREIVPKLKS